MKNYQPNIIPGRTRNSYSGILNQHEFNERYNFIRQRIKTGLEREDLAFLLGRTPYDIIDYEELSSHVKLDERDWMILATLFHPISSPYINFDRYSNRVDISHEKRAIRAKLSQVKNEICIEYLLPWTIYGDDNVLKICEPINTHNMSDYLNDHILSQISALLNVGYFRQPKAPYEIYQSIMNDIRTRSIVRTPIALRNVLYHFISIERISVTKFNSRFVYQSKS